MQSVCVKKLGTTIAFCLLVTLNTMTHAMDNFFNFRIPPIDKKTLLLSALVATNLLFLGVGSYVIRSLYKANREQSKRIESLEETHKVFSDESKKIAQGIVGINAELKELAAIYKESEQKKTMLLKQLNETAKDQAMINQDQAIMNKTLQEQDSIHQALEQNNATVVEELIRLTQNQATINRNQILTNQTLQKQSTEHQQTLRKHRNTLKQIIKQCIQPPPGTKESTNAEM